MKHLNTASQNNYEELKNKVKKELMKDSRKVEEKDSDMHEFAFLCSNSSFSQQLKSNTLSSIINLCKPFQIEFVVNSVDKHSLIIYFW